jgi:hypothetical protein
VGLVLAQFSTPNVLTNLLNQFPIPCRVAAVLLVLCYLFETSPTAYGLSLGRRWLGDFAGGAVIGVLFQPVSTAAIIATGSGRVVSSWALARPVGVDRLGEGVSFDTDSGTTVTVELPGSLLSYD